MGSYFAHRQKKSNVTYPVPLKFCCSKSREKIAFVLAKPHLQRNPYLEIQLSENCIMVLCVIINITSYRLFKREPVNHIYPHPILHPCWRTNHCISYIRRTTLKTRKSLRSTHSVLILNQFFTHSLLVLYLFSTRSSLILYSLFTCSLLTLY